MKIRRKTQPLSRARSKKGREREKKRRNCHGVYKQGALRITGGFKRFGRGVYIWECPVLS